MTSERQIQWTWIEKARTKAKAKARATAKAKAMENLTMTKNATCAEKGVLVTSKSRQDGERS